MNVLMIGNGKGSFEVRGKQLGAAIGARVRVSPDPADLAWADIVVLIKQAGNDHADIVRQANKPIVWDALDFWLQPEFNNFGETAARAQLRAWLNHIRPVLTIGATQAMAEACGGVYLPHHARPGLAPKPVRETVQIVAYEGAKKYLGKWAKAVQQECDRRGWQFVINPPDLSAADIIVALRDGKWDGWMCQNWKSGVKLVNAQAVHRPILTQPSASVDEISSGGCVQIQSFTELTESFDFWGSNKGEDARHDVACECAVWDKNYTLEKIAADYRTVLESVC